MLHPIICSLSDGPSPSCNSSCTRTSPALASDESSTSVAQDHIDLPRPLRSIDSDEHSEMESVHVSSIFASSLSVTQETFLLKFPEAEEMIERACTFKHRSRINSYVSTDYCGRSSTT